MLVASQNVKIATPSEALAHSVLHGHLIIPEEVVVGGEQQSFLDARVSPSPVAMNMSHPFSRLQSQEPKTNGLNCHS